MTRLDFFKKQAKNLLKDWQSQTKTVEDDGFISYHYDWKFYDVGDLFFYYEFSDEDEQEIILARAQHLIAKMVGFKKWNDLIHATETEQELAELLLRRFKNAQDVQDWEDALMFSGVSQYGAEAVLAYARHYYQLGDAQEIALLSPEKITVLQGKTKSEALNKKRGRCGMIEQNINDFTQKKTCIYKNETYSVRDNDAVMRHSRETGRKRSIDGNWTFGNLDDKGFLRIGGEKINRIVDIE